MWKLHGWKPIGVYDLFFRWILQILTDHPLLRSGLQWDPQSSPSHVFQYGSTLSHGHPWRLDENLGTWWPSSELHSYALLLWTCLMNASYFYSSIGAHEINRLGVEGPVTGTWTCHTQPPCFKFSWECIKFLWNILYGSKINANFFIWFYMYVYHFRHFGDRTSFFWGTKF